MAETRRCPACRDMLAPTQILTWPAPSTGSLRACVLGCRQLRVLGKVVRGLLSDVCLGMDAALMGCLWLTGPSKLAVQGLTMAIPQGAGQGPEQRLPQ